MSHYITKIELRNFLKVKKLLVELNFTDRRHLILTGKNGSGKTRLLLDIYKKLHNNRNEYNSYFKTLNKLRIESKIYKRNKVYNTAYFTFKHDANKLLEESGGVLLDFGSPQTYCYDDNNDKNFFYVFFNSKRSNLLVQPKSIQEINLNDHIESNSTASNIFLQYLANLKIEQAFSFMKKDLDNVRKIDDWFAKIEKILSKIFGSNSLKIIYDNKKFEFKIISNDIDTISFSHLPDGFYSVISIISELIMRMEALNTDNFNLKGIVLIDEIETHLHVRLQKGLLPLLNEFFPKVQFIVTTHSPFVVSSISNAVVCDLEKEIVTNDLSGYSYEAILESYFETDQYSFELSNKLEEYENLVLADNLSFKERERLMYLKDYFENLPKYISLELKLKLQDIQILELNK